MLENEVILNYFMWNKQVNLNANIQNMIFNWTFNKINKNVSEQTNVITSGKAVGNVNKYYL